jgi:uncharacterized protein YcfL
MTTSSKNNSLYTLYWYNKEGMDLKVVVVKFMTICHVEEFGLRLAKG